VVRIQFHGLLRLGERLIIASVLKDQSGVPTMRSGKSWVDSNSRLVGLLGPGKIPGALPGGSEGSVDLRHVRAQPHGFLSVVTSPRRENRGRLVVVVHQDELDVRYSGLCE